jgi:amino acid adenylation domain-containing protein
MPPKAPRESVGAFEAESLRAFRRASRRPKNQEGGHGRSLRLTRNAGKQYPEITTQARKGGITPVRERSVSSLAAENAERSEPEILQFAVASADDGGTPAPRPRGGHSWCAAIPSCASPRLTRTTAADLCHAAFAALIHRYSGHDDIVLERVSAGHGGPVRIRSTLGHDSGFAAHAAELAARHRAATGAPGDPSAEPAPDGAGLTVAFLDSAGAAAVERTHPADRFDLALEVSQDCGSARFTLHYDTGHFTEPFIARMAANYRTLLDDACRRPDTPVHDLTALSEPETRRLLREGGANTLPFPADTTLHSHIEAQAARTPDAPAVEWRDEVLTYRELDETANRLARALMARGVTPGQRIGVSVARTHRTICLLLAVHKAGCAYVPLDPSYPPARLTAIAETARMTAVVVDAEEGHDWLRPTGARALPWAELWEKARGESCEPPESAVGPASATHLIYTSGSTGRPKGVVISHRNVVALLAWAWQTYRPEELARVLFGTSLNFDLSVFELWTPLSTGGCVVVVDNVLALTENTGLRPTLINTVPSALTVLLERRAIRRSTTVLNVAGEPLSKELVNTAFATTEIVRLYNLYGPSEDTTYSTWKCFTGPTDSAPTIGVPVHNTSAYLLDARGRLVPHGLPGELHLAGAGVSGGYLNDPERTAASFVAAPPGLPAGTLYRTGDLAVWTEDGELRFLGRKDTQVKVRGFRVELGEIEAVVREVVGLRDVAALAVGRGADTLLVVYAGLEGDEIHVERIAEHLRRKLPHYMQPARIVLEDRLPHLPNGKIDRTALAARPVDWGAPGADLAGDDPELSAVAEVWTALLGLPRLAADLDFFTVGGHSLLATLLAARLGDVAGTTVRVAEIHAHRTLAEQAELVRLKRRQAPVAAETGTEARFAAVAATLRDSAAGHGVPGASIAVQIDGTLRVSHHGVDDTETGAPRTDESRQRITCITKALLAFVSLQLVDRGLLPLDEPLDGLLPDAFHRRDGGTARVTLRQLLAHTSGIDDSYEVWHDTDLPDLDTYLHSFRDYQQIFEPGEVFAYSACGTSIVAGLIERVTGRPWRRALNEMLLEPLGIRPVPETRTEDGYYGGTVSTGFLWNEAERAYLRHDPAPQTIADDAAGSFSICMTIDEVARIARLALDDGVTADGGRLLSARLAEQMRTPQIGVPGHHFMHAWGLGWLLFGPTAFGFNSNGSGHHNFIQIFPEQRSFLLLLANAYPAFGLYEDLLRTFTGEGLIRTGRPFEMKVADCLGRYASDGYLLDVLDGEDTAHPRYRYSERQPDGDWLLRDEGLLVSSGAGGFSSMSDKNVLAGSISFIPMPGTAVPGFVRIGQRFARKTS